MCLLGLTSVIALPLDQLPGEALERFFKATLDLLVSYKDQVAGFTFTNLQLYSLVCHQRLPNLAPLHLILVHHILRLILLTEAAKEVDTENDDDMDGFQSDEDDDGSDKEMGVDAEDGDEADSIRLQKLAAQVYSLF